MRKGLTVTLMTVAVAMMGLQAMAMAPVIGEIPSPIVADGSGATTPNYFVYPDAYNLADYVTDDYTAPANVLWSYWISGTPKYRINNIAPINPSSEDPVTPGSKAINTQVGSGEDNPDGNPATLTIRNINLSPIGSGTSGTEPGPTGKLSAETQVVSFFASDGTTYSTKNVVFYTYNNWDDQLTPKGTAVPVSKVTFNNTTNGCVFTNFNWGTITQTVSSAGICLTVPGPGDNAGQWSTAWGTIPLVKYNVYHIRLKMNCSQSAAGHTPFWDVVVQNYLDTPGQTPAWKGMNAYGVDAWFLDNRGGANSVVSSSGGTSMHVWFAPSPVSTAAWNAAGGIFDTSNGDNKDARFYWRVMDLSSSDFAITATDDSGTLCLMNYLIERFDISGMQTLSTDYSVTSLTDASSGGNYSVHKYYTQTTVTFAGGALTLQPNPDETAASNGDLIFAAPKDANSGHYDDDPLVPACYPVTWKANTLYQITYDLAAPDANSQTNPCDVFFIGADVPTNELIIDSYTTAGANQTGMPKTGTSQTFMAFFYSHNVTTDSHVNNARIRPKFSMGNNTGLVFTNTSNAVVPSRGGIKITGVKIKEVKFQRAAN